MSTLDRHNLAGRLLAGCCWLAAAAPALAQVPSELVEQALDQRIGSLEITAAPIRNALDTLEKETGLRFVVNDDVLALMPYGDATQIEIVVRDMSVRSALRQVFAGLGLAMRVAGDRVVIEPVPALAHLGRRLTIDEIALLDRLSREPWASVAGDPPIDLRIDPARAPRDGLRRALDQVRGDSALGKLDSACQALSWAWRPEGGRLVLTTREDETRRRLDRPIDVHYQKQMLDAVLSDLGARVGVNVLFEPGCLQQVDWREKRVEMTQKNVSPRQALERICGSTGLRYEIEADGVRVYGPFQDSRGHGGPPGAMSAPAGEPGPEGDSSADQRFVRIEIEVRPGVRMDALVPLVELPPALRREFHRRLDEVLSDLGRSNGSATP
ncbi:MAG TPA: hypothetical protein PKC49_13260 [Phycisphaerae bacterium]|nr:hypothetical protein [Phycisphaerae bacterium]